MCGLIRFYQLTFSSLIGRQCRHLPTCSTYMREAITYHGFWPGFWMGLGRIWRCRPGGTCGYDSVPESLPLGTCSTKPWRYGQWRREKSVEE